MMSSVFTSPQGVLYKLLHDLLDKILWVAFLIYLGSTPYSNAYFGEGSGAVHLNYIQCSGTEYNLTECEIAKTSRDQISHSQDVGVRCEPGKVIN